MTQLAERYQQAAVPALMKRFNYGNVMEVPRISKIVINIGLGEGKDNARAIDAAVNDVKIIAGQSPVVVKSRKSIAAFKLRVGMPIGVRVTLRGRRMEQFLEKLVGIALPRVRDFRGLSPVAFDGRGNYNLGLKEQIVFPEIDYDKIDKLRGLEVTIVTTARTDDEARELLSALGMPFRTPEQQSELGIARKPKKKNKFQFKRGR